MKSTKEKQKNGPTYQDNVPEIWKTLIKKHLGIRVRKKYRDIARDILLVDCGTKPGFLYDYSCVTADEIIVLLNELNKFELLRNFENLNVIEIVTDVFICHRKLLSKISWDRIKFVDITGSNSGSILPTDASELRATRKEFEWIQSHTDNICLSVRCQSDSLVNPTTLFGVMIGYPVVYWYDVSKENGAMLSMVPLKCIQIFQQRHLVYSFSVPLDLWSELEHVVHTWFSDQKLVSCDLTLQSDVKSLPSVAL